MVDMLGFYGWLGNFWGRYGSLGLYPPGIETIFPILDLDEFFNIIQHLHATAAA